MATRSKAATTTPAGSPAPVLGAATPTPTSPTSTSPTSTSPVLAAPSCGTDDRPMMTEQMRRDVLLRLRKISGQVQGISKMVEDDRYCVDVLQQLSAVSSAVDSVSRIVVRNYLERCVTDAINGGDPLIYDELMRVVFKHR